MAARHCARPGVTLLTYVRLNSGALKARHGELDSHEQACGCGEKQKPDKGEDGYEYVHGVVLARAL